VRVESADGCRRADGCVALVTRRLLGDAHLARAAVLLGWRFGALIVACSGRRDGGCGRVRGCRAGVG